MEFKEPKKFKIGNDNHLLLYKIEDILIRVYTDKRSEEKKHLSNVYFIPKVKFNLVSYGAITNKGFKITGDNNQCIRANKQS